MLVINKDTAPPTTRASFTLLDYEQHGLTEEQRDSLAHGLIVQVPITLTGGFETHVYDPTWPEYVRIKRSRRVVDRYEIDEESPDLALNKILAHLARTGKDRPAEAVLAPLDESDATRTADEVREDFLGRCRIEPFAFQIHGYPAPAPSSAPHS